MYHQTKKNTDPLVFSFYKGLAMKFWLTLNDVTGESHDLYNDSFLGFHINSVHIAIRKIESDFIKDVAILMFDWDKFNSPYANRVNHALMPGTIRIHVKFSISNVLHKKCLKASDITSISQI